MIESRKRFFKHGPSLRVLHDLGQVSYPQIVRHVHRPRGRILDSTDKLHYCRLAGTILTYESDLVRPANVEIYVVQQCKPAVGYSQPVNGDHSSETLAGRVSPSSSGRGLQHRMLAS